MIRRVFTRRLSLLSLAAAIGATAAMFASTAEAALLWYDGISLTDGGGDYVVDAPLSSAAGGSGSFFSGNWVDADAGDAASHWQSKGTGLSRPGLTQPVVGGAASNDGDFSCCYYGRTGRLFDTPWGGFTDPDGTFYMGFLANLGLGNADDPHHRSIELHDGGFDDTLNLNMELGIPGFAGARYLQLTVRDSLTNTTGPAAVLAENARLDNLAVQGAHYIVLKFEMSTAVNDVISVFLDPVGDVEPAPSASISVGQFLADRLTFGHFTFTGIEDPAAAYDEIRVGTEFADVGINTLPYDGTVVPEPATLGLVGLGLIGLACSKRRRS